MKHLKQLTLILVVLTLTSFIGLSVFRPEVASAATGEVIDRSTIKVGNQTFFDGDTDDNFSYAEQSPSDRCPDKIFNFDNSDLGPGEAPSEADIEISTPAGAGSDACVKKTETITFGASKSNFLKALVWESEGVIYGSDLKLTFNRLDNTNTFESEKENGGCRDTLTISSGNQTATLVARTDNTSGHKDDYDYYPFARPSNDLDAWKWNEAKECWESPAVTGVRLSGTPEAGNNGGASALAASDNTTNNKTCESIAGGAMSWALCPIIKILDTATATLDTLIKSQLEIRDPNGTCDITEDPKNEDCNLYKTWARIRNIALIILIPIMLVMVIGTALGYGGLDAYTVKRAMPRLLIAVLFISTSWYITSFLINITNVVGQGILGLMTQPFGVANQSLVDFITPDKAIGFSVVGIGVFAALFATQAISIGIIFSFILVAAIGLLIGFLTLVIRQILILALMVLAPLAIIAWIFPGNDTPWKLWWGTFSKLLLMYPLVMMLIGAGRIAASIIPSQQGSNGPFTQLLVVIAYILPYFFIPLTFKFAGGLLANISGFVNDRSKGLFDRQRKYRSEQSARGRERFGRRIVGTRADWQNRMNAAASRYGASGTRRGRAGAFATRFAGARIGGYNIQAADATRRAAVLKEINDQINTGRDDEIRGLTVDKATAARRIDSNGRVQYQSLGGKWINEADVDEGHRRWGRDIYAQQAALSYEMRKANTEDEVRGIATNYHNLQRAWHASDGDMGGMWIGAAFENQNQHLEYKYTSWQNGSMNADQARDYATEVYHKKGSYPMAQMHAQTITRLKEAYDIAGASGDTQTQDMVREVAETFMTRYSAGGRGVAGMEGEVPIMSAGPPVATATPGLTGPAGTRAPMTETEYMQQQVYQANTPGAAAVAQNVRDLAVHTGAYRPLPSSTDIHSARPPSQEPRQK